MYSLQLIILILFVISANTDQKDLISIEFKSCLSRSMEQVFFGYEQEKLDCSSLSAEIQMKLALHFTFCHLSSTGIQPNTICMTSSFDTDIDKCLKNITKNPFAYLTYTNFVPHVQGICYAIETQQWHLHVRDSIQQINLHSSRIESEIKKLLIEQDTLQTNLDQALVINQNSVEDALNVDRLLQTAQSDVDELRGHLYVKDKAQIELIQQILETLFNIQTSLFADAFGLSSYLFYAVSLFAIHLVTIPGRTKDAKFWLILLWLGLIGIERYILLFSLYPQIDLYNVLWRFRQLWFFVCCMIMTMHTLRYRNYYKENQRLIDEIDLKQKKLEKAAQKCLDVISKLDISASSASDNGMNSSSEMSDTSITSFSTDNDDNNDS